MHFKNATFVTVSFSSLVLTFYTVGKFMYFLSDPNKTNPWTDKSSIIRSLLIDLFLMSCFVLQHSLMISQNVKRFFASRKLDVILRSIYVITTNVVLLVLMKYWKTISQVTLWNFDTNNSLTWTIFTGIHLFAWSTIYAGCIFMDITELLGIKQVYYNLRDLPDPIQFKSPELKKLYGHNRHPSFSALVLIFWCFPLMTLDRLFLASIFTFYMYILWKTDSSDLRYHSRQYLKKQQELLHKN